MRPHPPERRTPGAVSGSGSPAPDPTGPTATSALQDGDDALPAGGADRDQRPAPRTGGLSLLREQLGRDGDDPPAGRGEGVRGRRRRTVEVEPPAVDRAERCREAEPLLAEHRVLPRRERGQHLRGERLVDLVVVEVLEREPVALQHPRDGVRRRHQQALVAVDVVDRCGLRVDEVGEHRQPPLLRPLVAGQQHRRGAIGKRGAVARGHRRGCALAEDRLEGGELLDRGVRAQVVVALDAAERGDEVVVEALLVGAREVVVGAGGQLVLRLAGDSPLQRRERGVLAHRELRAGLAVLRDVEADVAGADRAERPEPARGVLGGVDLHQLAAQLVADRDRRVGGGVGAAGDARVDDPERDLVGHLDRRLQAGAAGLLDVGGGGLGGEPGAEHALAGEVEVARVLEHRAGHDLAEPLAAQLEPVDEAVDGSGQHLLVGDAGVDGVGPGERDAVAADDGDRAGGGLHVPILAGESPAANGLRGTSRKVDSELQHALHIDQTVPSHQRRGNTATMSDRYQGFVSTPIGKLLVKNLGLPDPTRLERWSDGSPLVDGLVVLGGEGRLAETLPTTLDGLGIASATTLEEGTRAKALVFDATGITDTAGLVALQEFFSPLMRRLESCPRVVVISTPPEQRTGSERIAQRALEGFTRSLGKEIGRGGTVQLVYVAPAADGAIASTLAFLLSPKSAYVSGQVVRIGAHGSVTTDEVTDWTRPLAGKVALVTGASRGIGEEIARVLHRDGATVVGVDVPQAASELQTLMGELDGDHLVLDITAKDAPQRIAHHLREHHGGVDVVVHNAGITRDKKLANMAEDRWSSVVAVNLTAPELITRELLDQGVVNAGGRIVGVASIAGIAGNVGQTNYATSKAGVIGLVDSLRDELPDGITVNAVAPGFIITQMTAAVPFATREVGQRLNAMSQGGLPVDVAETIAWFASAGSGAVNGNVVRVCGQMMLGA